MDQMVLQKKLEELQKRRNDLMSLHLQDLRSLNEKIDECKFLLRACDRDSDLSRMVRTAPCITLADDITPVEIREQIERLIDGDKTPVLMVTFHVADPLSIADDLIFYLEKVLENT